MVTQSRDLFIKVLVDTIADDVRTEILAQKSLRNSDIPLSNPIQLEPDMVARLIDWKSRTGSREKRFSRTYSETKKTPPPGGPHVRQQPGVAHEAQTPEALFALALIEKLGAKFNTVERTASKICSVALERERRHLIFRLHPDRAQNEEDKISFSQKFVAATEAIATLRRQPVVTESSCT